MTSTSASQPASIQPNQLITALKSSRGDLFTKTAGSESWVRLESPTGDQKHNLYGVEFGDGITVLHWNKKAEGTCKVKLIVESPPTIIQDQSTAQSQWSLEAKCVEIKEPEFDSKSNGDKAPGIENAKTFALASLNKEIEVVKIGGLTKSNFNKKSLGDEELHQPMIRLAAGKARGSPAMNAGVMVIDKDGDVTVEVIEYDDQIRDGNGNRPVTRNLRFRGCGDQKFANLRGNVSPFSLERSSDGFGHARRGQCRKYGYLVPDPTRH